MKSVELRRWSAARLPGLTVVCAAAVSVALGGCAGWRYQAGLANAPGLNRPWDPDDFAHNAIANGDESCPSSGRAEDDRLFRRWPACGAPPRPVSHVPRPPPPPSPGQGLPPLADRESL